MSILTHFIFLILVGIADLILIATKQKTISAWYHQWLPQWIDYCIMIAIAIAIFVIGGATAFLILVYGIIMGHLFWHGTS